MFNSCCQKGLMTGSGPAAPPIIASFVICICILFKIFDCSLNISKAIGKMNMNATIEHINKELHLTARTKP